MTKLGQTEASLRINADAGATWVYDEVIGEHPIVLPLCRGSVDLRPLHEACVVEHAPFRVVAQQTSSDLSPLLSDAFMPLPFLLVTLFQGGPPLDWLTRQLVWQVGSLLDREIVRRKDIPETPPKAQPTLDLRLVGVRMGTSVRG